EHGLPEELLDEPPVEPPPVEALDEPPVEAPPVEAPPASCRAGYHVGVGRFVAAQLDFAAQLRSSTSQLNFRSRRGRGTAAPSRPPGRRRSSRGPRSSSATR